MGAVPFWQEAVEARVQMLTHCADSYLGPQCVTSDSARNIPKAEVQHGFLRIARNALRESDTYAWTPTTYAALQQSSLTIPPSATFDRRYAKGSSGWWFFGDYAFLWTLPSDGLFLALGEKTRGQWYPGPAIYWMESKTLGQMLADLEQERMGYQDADLGRERVQLIMRACQLFVGGMVWLHQKLLRVDTRPVERHLRKRLVRELDLDLSSGIQVVELRSYDTDHPRDPQVDPVEWSCRWIVRGHWRDQPYKDRRELIYIMPYIKGPDDKPLRTYDHTVFAVRR